jgi:hypothetical protein
MHWFPFYPAHRWLGGCCEPALVFGLRQYGKSRLSDCKGCSRPSLLPPHILRLFIIA